MRRNRVTIKDIALEARVTAQTVSRVFRNQGYISKKTKAAVLAAADKLNYVPNNAAISLRMGKTKNIAVVFDCLVNVYFAVMIDYLHREVQARGYSLQTIFADSPTITEEVYRSALSMGAVGVISFLEADDGLGVVVKNYGVPLLILGRRTDMQELDYLVTDDVQGGRLAAERLLRDGCKSFAYVAEGLGVTCIDDRFKGFCDTLQSTGVAPLLIDSSKDLEEIFRRLQEEEKIPDGIFCSCDMIAFRFISIMKKLGRGDVKVIGYDDLQSDIGFPFRITTIGVNKARYIALALELFLPKVEDEKEERIAEKAEVMLCEGLTA